jgi:hypothetical protein
VKFLFSALIAFAVLAGPAVAAKPTRTVVDLDDPAFEAEIGGVLSEACDAEIVADASGHVIISVFTDRTGEFKHELNVFGTHVTFTNADTGATYGLVDVGPDIYSIDRRTGHLTVAVTGRSLTGSGVIGRVVIDLETGEILSSVGNPQGDWVANACAALT